MFGLLVVGLTIVLNPDLYGLIPNSLDPVFYTGYAINLDDALAAAGNRHYFVTRWSSYLPQYVSCSIFGPYWGRLVLRLLMLSALFEMFWRLGSRFRFPPATRMVSALIVFFSPMFVRAFTTDYQEYTATFYGILLVGVVISQPFSWNWGLIVGSLSALLVVSNPFSFGLVGICSIVWFAIAFRRTTFKRILSTIGAFSFAFLSTLALGYLLFRFHFDVGNIYEPTIRFIRDFEPPQIDLWTSPGKEWIGHFGWLYIPVVVVIIAAAVFRDVMPSSKSIVRSVALILVMVYGFHVYMQVTKGHALETGYYWAMALPPVYLLLFLTYGSLVPKTRKGVHLGVATVVLVFLIRQEVPQSYRLGSGILLLATLLVLSTILFFLSWFRQAVVFTLFALFLLWIQLGSPNYSTLTYGGDLNSPRYDLTFGKQASISDDVLREVIWFNKQMDRIPEDWKSTFLSAGGWSAAIVATYVPHPFSRWVGAVSVETPLQPRVVYELEFGSRRYLSVFGDVNEVADLLPGVRSQLTRSKILLDETHGGGLGYRLVVLVGNGGEQATTEISLRLLDRTVGRLSADDVIEVSEKSGNGYATFGPYITLSKGHYRAAIEFESDSAGILGSFEAFRDETSQSFGTQLVSDGSGKQRAAVQFRVGESDGTWQFRTEYFGTVGMRITRITLDRLDQS